MGAGAKREGGPQKDSLCKDLDPQLGTVIIFQGSHHFGGNYKEIAGKIIDALEH